MSSAQSEDQFKPAKPFRLMTPTQSSFYLQASSSWHQRWQAVIEQCSDCFIHY